MLAEDGTAYDASAVAREDFGGASPLAGSLGSPMPSPRCRHPAGPGPGRAADRTADHATWQSHLLQSTIWKPRSPPTLAAIICSEPGSMNSSTPMPSGSATQVSGSHRTRRRFSVPRRGRRGCGQHYGALRIRRPGVRIPPGVLVSQGEGAGRSSSGRRTRCQQAAARSELVTRAGQVTASSASIQSAAAETCRRVVGYSSTGRSWGRKSSSISVHPAMMASAPSPTRRSAIEM